MAKIKIEITDQDIIRAEDLLLPVGSKFNDERREFLKCMESCDVIACPGSGKTTALLAKILILSWKMPLENNSGICVLTHTNVAIDEITRRIGSASDILFRHPNFFGTIQKFVDSFLCIPAYGTEYGTSLNSIDGE